MSNVTTYNQIINRFQQWAEVHDQIEHFSYGLIDVMDLEKFPRYPFMHVMINKVDYVDGMKTVDINVIFCDCPRNNKDKTEYQAEVLNDLQLVAEDLIASVTFSQANFFGDLVTVQGVSAEPFVEQYENTLTGWNINFALLVPFNPDSCIIPSSIPV